MFLRRLHKPRPTKRSKVSDLLVFPLGFRVRLRYYSAQHTTRIGRFDIFWYINVCIGRNIATTLRQFFFETFALPRGSTIQQRGLDGLLKAPRRFGGGNVEENRA